MAASYDRVKIFNKIIANIGVDCAKLYFHLQSRYTYKSSYIFPVTRVPVITYFNVFHALNAHAHVNHYTCT